MDTTSTIQAPSGPMTRARARAIQSEVTSLLLEFSPSSSETWLLPKFEILCVIRYNAQDLEPRTVEEETGVNTLDSPEPPARARNFRPPDPPADPELPASDVFDQPKRVHSLVISEPVPDLPASSDLPALGCQPSSTRANSLVRPDPPRNLRRPELPALPARIHLGRGPCTLSSPRLYILCPVQLSRVSIGLAH